MTNNRLLALNHAVATVGHAPHPDSKTPEGIVKAARIFEEYLNGGDPPANEVPQAETETENG